MSTCVYCQTPLSPGRPWAPGAGYRLAYDPHKGRLWAVCTGCGRWNLTPLEDRWESLEACEEAVQTRGTVHLSTPHLSLVRLDDEGELIRVGEAPRSEFVGWRYGDRVRGGKGGAGFWSRLLFSLPDPPVDGYDPYGQILRAPPSGSWLFSPFLSSASALTYLFSQVPLAPECPGCQRPMALNPWDFQAIEMAGQGSAFLARASCALCSAPAELDLDLVRPALRLGLAAVTPPPSLRGQAEEAARELDLLGGAGAFLRNLTSSGALVGDLDALSRSALIISLDEMAEAQALEAEWSSAEEMAAIMDGELTQVPGFQAFRQSILDPES